MSEPTLTIKQYNESFLRELDRLNDAQRQAVETIEGPVLVIAGPGTGKTHILTARIGRILMETDAQAQNILCLTFTDAGVHAMRERLLEFIGPEAHRVHIYTFHSFCNSIIQDNLELFGRQDLEPLSELERVEIIRRLIDSLSWEHPLKKGRSDFYFYEEHLYDLFKRMKAENWTVDLIHQKIDDYLKDLPHRPEFIYQISRGAFKKGALKVAKLEDVRIRMERLRAAASLFPLFESHLQQARRYDYEDMILWVLRAFAQNDNLLKSYQEQYLYFLIDEYQDTNGAQNEIIKNLVSYWPSPNLFIVGDDDQSIYEFQGARLKNLTEFYQTYQDGIKLLILQDNYRSSQHILDSSRVLIQHNEKRIVNQLQNLGLEKRLKARHIDFAQSPLLPKLVSYPNRAHEDADIVNQIEKLQNTGFPLDKVAVIYAKHKQVRNIITLLEKKGIPYNARKKVNILHLPLVRNLRMFLEFLQLEINRPHSGEYLLFKILHFPFLGISPDDLAKLSIHQAQYNWDKRPPWRELLQDQKQLQALNLAQIEPIQRFSSLISHLLGQSTTLSVTAFLERLLNRSGLLNYILQHEDKLWLLQVIKSFFDFVIKESDRNPRIGLKRLLDILNSMDDNRLAIEVVKTVYAEEGVNLLTAHSAKGLEFQHVYIIDSVKDNWEPRTGNSAYRFPLPDTMTYSGEEDALEARRRLFYVAMTRAKSFLHISYAQQRDDDKDLERAIFVDELLEDMSLELEPAVLDESVLVEAELLQMLETQKVHLPTMEKDTVNALLNDFMLSVSALNSYLRCPIGFYFEYVLRVPSLMSEAASYGTAMHNALQRLFEQMSLSKNKSFPSKQAFIRLFEYEMQKLKGYFSPKAFQQRMTSGKQNLAIYYQQHIAQWPKNVKAEFKIRNVEVDGVPLTGTIDRVDLLDQQKVKIIDYKTGSQSPGKIRKPSTSNPYGGNYWRQLIFYKILLEAHNNRFLTAQSGTISYLEPGPHGQFNKKIVAFKAADVSFVKSLIQETYQSILAHKFYQGCDRPDCHWCRFARNNILIDSWANSETEEMDD